VASPTAAAPFSSGRNQQNDFHHHPRRQHRQRTGNFSVILSNAVVVPRAPRCQARRLDDDNEVVTILDDERPATWISVTTAARPNDVVRALALQPDLKLVFGGDFTTVNGVIFNHISVCSERGFGHQLQSGTGADDIVYAVASQSDRKFSSAAPSPTSTVSAGRDCPAQRGRKLDTSFAPVRREQVVRPLRCKRTETFSSR